MQNSEINPEIYYLIGLLSFSIGEIFISLVESNFKLPTYIIVSTICTYFFIKAAKTAIKKAKLRNYGF